MTGKYKDDQVGRKYIPHIALLKPSVHLQNRESHLCFFHSKEGKDPCGLFLQIRIISFHHRARKQTFHPFFELDSWSQLHLLQIVGINNQELQSRYHSKDRILDQLLSSTLRGCIFHCSLPKLSCYFQNCKWTGWFPPDVTSNYNMSVLNYHIFIVRTGNKLMTVSSSVTKSQGIFD